MIAPATWIDHCAHFFLENVWQPDATAARRDNIVMGLLIEDMTVVRMIATVRRNILLLDGALSENNMRLQLRTGERLAIVDAVAALAHVPESQGVHPHS